MQPADSQLPTRVWRAVAQTFIPFGRLALDPTRFLGSVGMSPEQAAACGIEGNELKSA